MTSLKNNDQAKEQLDKKVALLTNQIECVTTLLETTTHPEEQFNLELLLEVLMRTKCECDINVRLDIECRDFLNKGLMTENDFNALSKEVSELNGHFISSYIHTSIYSGNENLASDYLANMQQTVQLEYAKLGLDESVFEQISLFSSVPSTPLDHEKKLQDQLLLDSLENNKELQIIVSSEIQALVNEINNIYEKNDKEQDLKKALLALKRGVSSTKKRKTKPLPGTTQPATDKATLLKDQLINWTSAMNAHALGQKITNMYNQSPDKSEALEHTLSNLISEILRAGDTILTPNKKSSTQAAQQLDQKLISLSKNNKLFEQTKAYVEEGNYLTPDALTTLFESDEKYESFPKGAQTKLKQLNQIKIEEVQKENKEKVKAFVRNSESLFNDNSDPPSIDPHKIKLFQDDREKFINQQFANVVDQMTLDER